MTKKKYKPQDYPKLREVWYKKLERSGFKDIEPHENTLKTWTLEFTRRSVDPATRKAKWESTLEWSSMAGQFLNHYKFKSNLEKVVWEYHADGISVRNIAKLLKRVKIMKPNKDNVLAIITRLTEEMKKMYLVGYK